MPTQAKIDKVRELKEKLDKCSIVVTASYSNIPVNEMTELRRRTREAGVEFLVIKNSLMGLAADAAQVPQLKEITQGPTAIALGYDEPVDVARVLHDYIRSTRSALAIQGAVMGGGPVLQKPEVERLATLPPRDQLVAQLLGQLQAPIYGLLSVLSGPLRNFGGLLQARIHQLETEGAAATAEADAEDEAPVAEAAVDTTETDAAAEEPQAAAEADAGSDEAESTDSEDSGPKDAG